MSGPRPARHRLWTGALLLAVQLAGGIALAVGHLRFERDPADHIEPPGSHGGAHNEAFCHVCRHADLRFLPGSGAGLPARAAAAVAAPVPVPRLLLLPRRLDASTAPRAPPLA